MWLAHGFLNHAAAGIQTSEQANLTQVAFGLLGWEAQLAGAGNSEGVQRIWFEKYPKHPETGGVLSFVAGEMLER